VRLVAALLVSLGVLAGLAHASPPPVPAFSHVVVVVFENKDEGSVIGRPEAPTFNAMARRYATLTRYYGVAHPSLPNYLALVSGSTHGIRTDCTSCAVSGPSLADTLAAAGKTWKLYAEGLPAPGSRVPYAGGYAKKHDPFMYFRGVAGDPSRAGLVVPFAQLAADERSQRVPDFSFVVPNLCHSMHDCPVRTGDAWLGRLLPPLLRLPETAVFVVFDEGTTAARGGGLVPALVLGTAVRAHARFTRVTGHYGLLRTVEDAWGLRRLGASARAAPITGIWR
jgi:phosphatidylinositol-3-phosphatase